MTIAQALLASWKEESKHNTSTSKIAPLEYFMKYQYTERYVKLCQWLNLVPLNYGAWLRKDINSVV